MSETQRTCFVIMPFSPELHYFYLFLKQHLEKEHGLKCQRGDDQVLTQPIIEKTKESILKADLLIADCSGCNPNVFYELGLAHAYNKKVILITHDPIEEVPADIRHYDFIRYNFSQHGEFLEKLDNAIRIVFAPRYESLYETAKSVFTEFCQATQAQAMQASEEEFVKRVVADEGKFPASDKAIEKARFVLPKIVANSQDIDVMDQITDWLKARLKTE